MSVLQIADARKHLNISGTSQDTELQAIIDAAEAAIVMRVGPLVSTPVTFRAKGGGKGLLLTVTPALSLTSVTPVGGTALTLADLYLDERAGLVTYNSGAFFTASAYDVAYAAGRTTTPADLLNAVKELVRHLWMSQRGPTRRPGSPPSDAAANTLPGAAHTLPFRVTELIAPHRQYDFG